MKLGKWIGGGLGWAFFGPIGALLGFTVGAFLDAGSVSVEKRETRQGDFMLSLIVLIAAVIKADGKVLKSELDYVKGFLRQNFGEEAASDSLLMLRDILKQHIPVDDVAAQIGRNMNYESKLQLIHFLFNLANADKVISPQELQLIDHIAAHMGISSGDISSLKAMFKADTDSSYKILEISPNASDDEVKSAFRELAKKHHPDKVSYLGEEIQKSAQEKFRKINEAYETIKKQRGIK